MQKQLRIRKSDIKLKKINIRGDEIAIIFLSLIFFLFLVFSSFRILPIGKMFDDFIFTFLFGWTKFLVYLLLFIFVIPIFFNCYFKIKFSFLLAISSSLLFLTWLVQNIVLIANNDNDMWFSIGHFHISMIKDYFNNWWSRTIINNYHGFFAQPISFFNWNLISVFPPSAVGGVISNAIISVLSYPFFLNFVISVLFIIIVFSWLIFSRPFLFFKIIAKLISSSKLYFRSQRTKEIIEQSKLLNKSPNDIKLNVNKKHQKRWLTKAIEDEKNIVVNAMKQQVETRNKITTALFNENNFEQVQPLVVEDHLKPEILFSVSNNNSSYFTENSNLTPFGINNFDNNLQKQQKEVPNIIEENSTL